MSVDDQLLYVNGINGETGEYLVQPFTFHQTQARSPTTFCWSEVLRGSHQAHGYLGFLASFWEFGKTAFAATAARVNPLIDPDPPTAENSRPRVLSSG